MEDNKLTEIKLISRIPLNRMQRYTQSGDLPQEMWDIMIHFRTKFSLENKIFKDIVNLGLANKAFYQSTVHKLVQLVKQGKTKPGPIPLLNRYNTDEADHELFNNNGFFKQNLNHKKEARKQKAIDKNCKIVMSCIVAGMLIVFGIAAIGTYKQKNTLKAGEKIHEGSWIPLLIVALTLFTGLYLILGQYYETHKANRAIRQIEQEDAEQLTTLNRKSI